MKYSQTAKFAFLGLIAAQICWTLPAQAARPMDVNDVSVLWPLPANKAERKLLVNLDQKGPGKKLLSESNFQRILKIGQADRDPRFGTNGEKDPANWAAVAIRFDPCGKILSLKECNVELRLVLQPLSQERPDFGDLPDSRPLVEGRNGGNGQKIGDLALDQTIHLIYTFPESRRQELTEEFVALSRKNPGAMILGKPLGVHPVLAKQGLRGSYAKALREFVYKYADEKILSGSAVMLTLRGGIWNFGASVMVNGVLTQVPIPSGNGNNIALLIEKDEQQNPINRVEPRATGIDNVNDIVNSNRGLKGERSPLERLFSQTEIEKMVEQALRIENPDKHVFASADCVSCHHASRALMRVKGLDFLNGIGQGADAVTNPNVYKAPEGVTSTFVPGPLDGGPYSVRMFGYRGDVPEYVKRTVNESAAVAEHVNSLVDHE